MRFLEFNERGRKEIQSSDAFKKEQNVKLVTNFAAAHHIYLYFFKIGYQGIHSFFWSRGSKSRLSGSRLVLEIEKYLEYAHFEGQTLNFQNHKIR